jgi:hypothetical protein
MTCVTEENKTVTDAEVVPLQTTNDPGIEQDPNHDKLLERIDHLEQINLELINHLKEKAVRALNKERRLIKS